MSPKSFTFLRYITTIFDNIKEAVVLLSVEEDKQFRLILANKPFHSISGYQEDAVGKELAEFVPPDLIDTLRQQFSGVVKSKKPVSFTVWAKVPIGEHAYELDAIPVLSTVDEVVQIIILARDVTELTKLRQEVQELRETNYLKDS